MNVSMLRKRLGWVADNLENDTTESLSKSEIIGYMIANFIPMQKVEYDGGFYSRTYYLIKNDMYFDDVTPKLMQYPLKDIDKNDLASYYMFLKQNRMLRIASIAFSYVIDSVSAPIIRNDNYNRYTYIQAESDTISREIVLERLRGTSVGVIAKNTFLVATKDYNKLLKELEDLLQVNPNGSKRGLAEYYENKPGKPFADADTKQVVEDQIDAAYLAMPSNGLTSRTWGFELEIADAKGVDAPFNIDKGEDGSLRSYETSGDCECDCDDCSYHDCDCDYCDSQNTDPEHCNNSYCSSADMAEFRSKNGISRLKHAGLFKLCKSLAAEDAEVNDSCGVHIHVYSADLKPEHVANVLASYKWLENIMAIVAERDDTSYARRLQVADILTAMRKKEFTGQKSMAVNVMHMGIGGTRGTIEFRQMLGNYNAERITFWAWLVRGLVETAKRGAKFHDFKGAEDINGIIAVYAKFNYYLHDEGTQLLIPGGRLDNNYIPKTDLKRAVV